MSRIFWVAAVIALVLCSGAEAEEICRFFRNGQNHGRIVEADLSDPANVAQLKKSILPIAKILGMIRFDAPSEFDLVNGNGELVASFLDCPKHQGTLYLLRRGDVWVYPGINPGYHYGIAAEKDREYSMTTLSVHPKVFSVEDLLTAEECQQLIALAREETAKTGLKMYTLSADRHPIVSSIQKGLSSFLRVPVELMLSTPGLEISVHRPLSPKERDLISPRRDFSLKPDFESLREELDKGRNTLATVIVFLETKRDGGLFFPLISDSNKKMVKFTTDGNMQVNIDPTLKACEKTSGLTVPAQQGNGVLFYHLLPDGVMNGKVDPNTLYQYCTDRESEMWTMSLRVPNKTWYYSVNSPFLQLLDVGFSYLFGTDFTKSVLMNGYGWDWHENPRGHFSHKIDDLAGRHTIINTYGQENGQI